MDKYRFYDAHNGVDGAGRKMPYGLHEYFQSIEGQVLTMDDVLTAAEELCADTDVTLSSNGDYISVQQGNWDETMKGRGSYTRWRAIRMEETE